MTASHRQSSSVTRWTAAAVLAAGAVAGVHGLGGVPYFRDRLYYFWPQYEACRAALEAGEVPLWNPAVHLGLPLLGTWQVAPLSPLSLPFLLMPWPEAVRIFWLLLLPLAAAGMTVFAREAGLSACGAAVAGLVFALAGPLRTLGEWPPIAAGLGLMPLLLAGVARLARGAPGGLSLTALAAALQLLAGQPRGPLIAGLAAGGWWAALRWSGRRPRLAGPGLLAAAAALAIAAAQLVPAAELILQSARRRDGIPASTIHESFLGWRDLLTVLAPRWWGTEDVLLEPGRLFMPRWYLGGLVLWLCWHGRAAAPRAVRLYAAVLLPAAGLLAMNERLYTWLAAAAGVAPPLRYLGHAALAALPSIALLAGAGAARGPARPGGKAAWILPGLAAAVAALAWVTPVRDALLPLWAPRVPPAAFLDRLALGLAATAAALIVGRWLAGAAPAGTLRRPRHPQVWLFAVLAADLGWAVLGHEAKAPAALFARPAVADRLPLRDGLLWSPVRTRPVFPELADVRMRDRYRARFELLAPNIPLRYGVRNLGGYEPLIPARSAVLLDGTADTPGPAPAGVRAAGIRWYAGPSDLAPAGWTARARPVAGWGVFEAPAPALLPAVLGSGAIAAPWSTLDRQPRTGSCREDSWTANTLALAVHATAAGVVATSTPGLAGWRAEVDGRRVRPRLAGGVFLAAPVPAGASRVTFRYVPLPFAVGLWLGAVALALLAARGLRPGPR